MHRARPIHEIDIDGYTTKWPILNDRVQVDIKENYGYTPLKIGTPFDFSSQRAYDLYLEGYSIRGAKCFDIYPANDRQRYCLAQVQDGINIKGFDYNPDDTIENMAEETRNTGKLFINNLDLGLLLNRVRRITKAKD